MRDPGLDGEPVQTGWREIEEGEGRQQPGSPAGWEAGRALGITSCSVDPSHDKKWEWHAGRGRGRHQDALEQAAVLAALRVLEARGSNPSAARALRCFKVMEKTDEGAAFVKWIFALSRDQEQDEAFGVMKATALFSFLDMEMWRITPHSELQRGKYKTSYSVGQAPHPSFKKGANKTRRKQLSFYGDLWLEVCASSVKFLRGPLGGSFVRVQFCLSQRWKLGCAWQMPSTTEKTRRAQCLCAVLVLLTRKTGVRAINCYYYLYCYFYSYFYNHCYCYCQNHNNYDYDYITIAITNF